MPTSRGGLPLVRPRPQTTAWTTGVPCSWISRNAGFQRRSRWVAHRAVSDPERYRIERIEEGLARRFCERHHYAGNLGAVRLSIGLYERGRAGETELVGVCVFGMLMQPRAAERWCGQDSRFVPEPHRLCLRDRAPFNAESFFVARALISYSDPVPRFDAAGRMTKFGHVGVCNQALQMRFTGTSRARTLILSRAGAVLSARSLSKLRNGERGACYAERQLLAAGAPGREPGEEARDYVARSLRHPGNLGYVMALDDSADTRARLAPALPHLNKRALGLEA